MDGFDYVLSALSKLGGIASLVLFAFIAWLTQKIRGDMSEFRNEIGERMNKLYLRKPDFEADYPLTKREFDQQFSAHIDRDETVHGQILESFKRFDDRLDKHHQRIGELEDRVVDLDVKKADRHGAR